MTGSEASAGVFLGNVCTEAGQDLRRILALLDAEVELGLIELRVADEVVRVLDILVLIQARAEELEGRVALLGNAQAEFAAFVQKHLDSHDDRPADRGLPFEPFNVSRRESWL